LAHDKVIETTELFSLFWKNLEAHCFDVLEESGSSLFWKNLEAHCFGSIWKLTVFAFSYLEESGSSLISLIICTFLWFFK
jgi:hypothetical protein